MGIDSIGTPLLWAGFTAFVLAMLVIDMGVFHKKAHVVHFREALTWSIFWVGPALLFNWGVLHWFGSERAVEFLTAYVIEKALSVDNLFVFLVIFAYFKVPRGAGASRPALGNHRRPGDAGGFHSGGRRPAAAFPLGHLCVRRLAGGYRNQIAGGKQPDGATRKERHRAFFGQSFAGNRYLSRKSFYH